MAEHRPIYLTGASGYLGSHIRAQADVVPIARGDYKWCRAQVVIHCAALVPRSDIEATDEMAAAESVSLLRQLLSVGPMFVVFPSTREVHGAYAAGKRTAEQLVAPPYPAHVIRFPGLFGPPRTSGLVYNSARHVLAGLAFQAAMPLPDWTCMPVTEAADLCIQAARARVPGLTVARNQAIEEFLQWVRT